MFRAGDSLSQAVATASACVRRSDPSGAARFNYGSTVIVLLPQGVAELAPGLAGESPVRLGERLATLRP